MWIAARSPAASKLRRRVLPSIESVPHSRPARAAVQDRKQRSKASGSRRAKTRAKVSWQGVASGRSRKVPNQSALARPKAATPTQSSAPQITAQIAMVTRAVSGYRLPWSLRGSGKCSK
jgi:hypothetical protein